MHRSSRPRLVVTTVALALAGLVAAHADNPSPDAPQGDPTIMLDSAGRLAEVVVHFDADFAEAMAPLFDSLLDSLPVDVRCLVLCPTSASRAEFEARWGEHQRLLGRDVDVENVDRPITIWARDRRIARTQPDSGLPASLLSPAEWPQYAEDQRNDLLVNYLLERRGLVADVEDTFLHLEGGDLVANNRHVFLGVNVLEDNEKLGRKRCEIKRELLDRLGRDPVIIGEETGGVPWEHVDMYLTPADDRTLLVASPTVALILLFGDPGFSVEMDNAPGPGPLLRDLIECHDDHDAVADQLAAYDYEIVRLPGLASASDWMISYNNVLMEERDGRRIVYMPVYQIARLDQAAEAIYRSLGFEVRRIDVSGVYQWGGALRCMVNVLERDLGEVRAPQPDVDGAAVVADASGAGNAMLPVAWVDEDHAGVAVGAPAAVTVPAHEVKSQMASVGEVPSPASLLWLPALIFLSRVFEVSLGVFRLICITRGRLLLATSLAALEVTVWILAVASVLTHLDNWMNVVAYIAGFTTGNAVGLWIDRRLGPGMHTISLITRDRGAELAEALRAANLRVTTLNGTGRDGAVHVATLIVPRRRTPEVLNLARRIDPSVIATVEDVQQTSIADPGRPALVWSLPATVMRGLPWRGRRVRLHPSAVPPAPETAA